MIAIVITAQTFGKLRSRHRTEAPLDVWTTYFESTNERDFVKKENVPISVNENKECFIYDCTFVNYPTTHPIQITSVTDTKFLDSNCNFFSCNSNSHGGSIQFEGTGISEVIQRRICATDGKILSNSLNGYFAYIKIDKDGCRNYILESSLFNLGAQNFGNSLNYISNGNCNVTHTNISKTKSNYDSAMILLNTKNSKLEFITVWFVETVSRCMTFNTAPSTTIINSNFIKIWQTIATQAGSLYFYMSSFSSINNSYFENLQHDIYLFYTLSSKISANKIYIDPNLPSVNYTNSQSQFTLTEQIMSYTSVKISHNGTYKCEAQHNLLYPDQKSQPYSNVYTNTGELHLAAYLFYATN